MKNFSLHHFLKRNYETGLEKSAVVPARQLIDWQIILFIFVAGLILLAFFAWQIFLSNNIGGVFLNFEEETAAPSVKIIDESRLHAGILILEKKQIDLLKSKAEHSQLIDPSL